MARTLVFTLIITLLLISRVFAQPSANNFDKVWVQGSPFLFTTTFTENGAINSLVDTSKPNYFFFQGHSNICDSFGNLLLCSNGYNVFDRHLNLIEDGDSLVPNAIYDHYNGFTAYSQSSIFLPVENNKYYFITPTASDDEFANWQMGDNISFDLLLYNIIDMNANSGVGKVVKRMAPLLQDVKLSRTMMMACKHADGRSWWLLKQAHDTNLIYRFLFTADSVYGPYVQGFSEPHFTKQEHQGQSVFNNNGTKYAATTIGADKIFIADFDRCSGLLSNPLIVNVPVQNRHNPYDTTLVDNYSLGLAFSPNDRFLYVNGFTNIQQLDLQDVNPTTAWSVIAGLDTTWDATQFYEYQSLGPDGKIYVGNYNGLSGQMSVINNPNSKGSGCDFCPRCLRFPGWYYNGTLNQTGVTNPPCMPNYQLGAVNCGGDTTEKPKQDFLLYPNPAAETITVVYSYENCQLVLTDMLGRIAQTTVLPKGPAKQELALTALPAGIYCYRFMAGGKLLHSGKLVVGVRL